MVYIGFILSKKNIYIYISIERERVRVLLAAVPSIWCSFTIIHIKNVFQGGNEQEIGLVEYPSNFCISINTHC